jgi:hypothetical protein
MHIQSLVGHHLEEHHAERWILGSLATSQRQYETEKFDQIVGILLASDENTVAFSGTRVTV